MKNVFALVLFVSLAPAQSVSTGLSFLKLGVGARSVAMGEAYTAVAGDHSSSFYNPAAAGFAAHNEIVLMHKSWISETTTEYLGSTITGDGMNYGFSLLSTSVDGIEVRLIPGEPIGTFSARNISAGGMLSYRFSERFSAGASGKFLYEKIFTDEAEGYGIDVGALYKIDERFHAGVSVLNIGSMNKLRAESSKLPTTLRLGVSYRTAVDEQFAVTGALDAVQTLNDDHTHFHAGAEAGYDNLAFFRAGYQTGYEFRSFSAGAGVLYRSIKFDYAFVPFSGAFNSTHTFSLAFLL